MKKLLVLALVAAVTSGAIALAGVQAAQKPEKGIIVGTIVEFSTYAMKGLDENSAESMAGRAEHGFPVGIIDDETGESWILVYRDSAPASHLETANKYVMDLLAKKAVVQGLKYRAGGVNVIRASVISEY